MLHETFTKTLADAHANPLELVGSGYYALIRLDEFVESRVVEAVVHGLDLTDALGRDPAASRSLPRSSTSCWPGARSPSAPAI